MVIRWSLTDFEPISKKSHPENFGMRLLFHCGIRMNFFDFSVLNFLNSEIEKRPKTA